MSLGEDWCRNKSNIAMPQRRDVDVTTLRESLNKPYLLEKLKKERENPILGIQKLFVVLGFEELEFGTMERRLEARP